MCWNIHTHVIASYRIGWVEGGEGNNHLQIYKCDYSANFEVNCLNEDYEFPWWLSWSFELSTFILAYVIDILVINLFYFCLLVKTLKVPVLHWWCCLLKQHKNTYVCTYRELAQYSHLMNGNIYVQGTIHTLALFPAKLKVNSCRFYYMAFCILPSLDGT